MSYQYRDRHVEDKPHTWESRPLFWGTVPWRDCKRINSKSFNVATKRQVWLFYVSLPCISLLCEYWSYVYSPGSLLCQCLTNKPLGHHGEMVSVITQVLMIEEWITWAQNCVAFDLFMWRNCTSIAVSNVYTLDTLETKWPPFPDTISNPFVFMKLIF